MGITANWKNEEQTVVLLKFEPGWTWEDFDAAVDTAYAMMGTVSHLVAAIVDASEAPDPPDTYFLEHIRRTTSLRTDNFCLMLVVGAGHFLREISTVFHRFLPHRQGFSVQFVTTLEEAEAIIAERLARSLPTA